MLSLISKKKNIGVLIVSLCIFHVAKSQTKWDPPPVWSNQTHYTRTYVVSQNKSNTSDNNPGTEDLPLKTINKAAQLAIPGEKILIHKGVYREMIQPKRGGTSENQMISYEGVPGEKVVVKGSKILHSNWLQREVVSDILPDSASSFTWSKNVWFTTVPDSFFEDGYYPMRLQNITPEQYALMPWAGLVKNLSPYNSTRALLFQDDKRMIQLDDYGDVKKVPGSFWVGKNGKTIFIHPFSNKDPNQSLMELAVKEHLFLPQTVGLNYIQIKGITFEQCSNGFLRTNTGAITALGGHHWIIENNIIRQINSSGLEFGYLAFEFRDPNPLNVNSPRQIKSAIGGMIVRNNKISDCGTAGIRSYVVDNALIENNEVYNCGWQDAQHYWEVAGIKLLETHHSLIRRNLIYNMQGGNGIWLDWDNRDSRVTQNIIYDIQTVQAAIFVEASHFENLIDNNFIWDVDGSGIFANDTDSLLIYHNLIGNVSGNVVHAIVQTDRSLNGRKLTSESNRILNNIFINGLPIKFDPSTNISDYNLYASTCYPSFNSEEIQKQKEDLHSQFLKAKITFDPKVMYFTWKSNMDLRKVPSIPGVSFDFFNNPGATDFTVPGPFLLLNKSARLLLGNE